MDITNKISNLLVLESAKGFYIGRVIYTSPTEYQPYDRVSTYYSSEEVAQYHLDNNSYIELYD